MNRLSFLDHLQSRKPAPVHDGGIVQGRKAFASFVQSAKTPPLAGSFYAFCSDCRSASTSSACASGFTVS